MGKNPAHENRKNLWAVHPKRVCAREATPPPGGGQIPEGGAEVNLPRLQGSVSQGALTPLPFCRAVCPLSVLWTLLQTNKAADSGGGRFVSTWVTVPYGK